jgi:aspartate 1-decarboxylase
LLLPSKFSAKESGPFWLRYAISEVQTTRLYPYGLPHLETERFDEEVEQMERLMLKSKIHGATLTGTELDYQGSITIDEDVLEKANILPGEQVHVLNINNGQRFITYAIAAPRGSETVLLNGPAARLGTVGDKVIIISYCQIPAEKAEELRAKIVIVDDRNRPKEKKDGSGT